MDRPNFVLFIHPSVDGHLSCYHFSATLNKAAMNIYVQVLFSIILGISIPSCGNAGLCGNSTCNILRNCQTAFHSELRYLLAFIVVFL